MHTPHPTLKAREVSASRDAADDPAIYASDAPVVALAATLPV